MPTPVMLNLSTPEEGDRAGGYGTREQQLVRRTWKRGDEGDKVQRRWKLKRRRKEVEEQKKERTWSVERAGAGRRRRKRRRGFTISIS